MRGFAVITLAATLLTTSAYAAGTEIASPLPAGKPAGVKQAQIAGGGLLLIAGIAIVAGGIALVASEGNSGNNVSVTTTGTAP